MRAKSSIADLGERSLRLATAELDRGLRNGSISGAETLLDKFPILREDAEKGVELVFAEYLTWETLGKVNHPADYYRRFPDWRERLERLFQVDELLKEDSHPQIDPNHGQAKKANGDFNDQYFAGYQLLEKLGSGGMGVVYKALQPKLKRIVALKRLRAGSDASAAILARFRREAELTARLRHAHIVPVFEVGEEQGEPFLVMEYVEGGTLHDHLAHRILPADDSTQLIEKLARAIDYAHQQNIVHRDLKPANILLDGVPAGSGLATPTVVDSKSGRDSILRDWNPRITDFGLAVCRDQTSALTRQGQILGTPSYMAPEQATGQVDETSIFVDIYSLGAILYECLTGRPPFLADTELETIRQVVHDDPVRPRELQPRTPRDLETVCLKCLHKDPSKRYRSALELADDLQRIRNGESILARPVGMVESAIKWIRRRPTISIAASIFLVAIIAGLILSANYATHLNAAKRNADLDADRAYSTAQLADSERLKAVELAMKLQESLGNEERQRKQSRQVLDHVAGEVIDQWFIKLPQLTDQHRTFLNQLLSEYELLASEKAKDPESRLALARAFRRVGDIRQTLGELHAAEQAFRRAETEYENLTSNNNILFEKLEVIDHRSVLAERQGRNADCLAIRKQAVELSEFLANEVPGEYRSDFWLVRSYNALARQLSIHNQNREARPFLERANEIIESTDWLDRQQFRVAAASNEDGYGQVDYLLGQRESAEKHYRNGVKLISPLVGEIGSADDALHLAARIEVNLGVCLRSRSDGREESLLFTTQAVEKLSRLVKSYPGVVKYRQDLGIAKNSIALNYMDREHVELAINPLRESIQAYESVLRDSPSFTSIRVTLGGSYCNLGIVERDIGQIQSSIESLLKAWQSLEPLLKDNLTPTAKQFAINTSWNLARSLSKRAASETDEQKKKTIQESLNWLRKCQEIRPSALSRFLNVMQKDNDFLPLREDLEGLEFLKSISAK